MVPVVDEVFSVVVASTLPTISWSGEPVRGRKAPALERGDLRSALLAACRHIRDLERLVAFLQRFAQKKTL